MCPDVVLLTGDVSNALSLEDDLHSIQHAANAPVYAVLGNHDYFGSSFTEVQNRTRMRVSNQNMITWLDDVNYISLPDDIALVGNGCWGDASAGSYWNSSLSLELPDFREIEDFRALSRQERLQLMKSLGKKAARHLADSCFQAAQIHQMVIVLTHVPPFPQVCLFEGRVNNESLAFFCCAQAGKALRDVAVAFPGVRFIVLSGHSHEEAEYDVLPNLRAIVQGAQYHKPSYRAIEFKLPTFSSG